jgi:hypothetical protein
VATDLLESRYTPARDDCPHPEYWHSHDDDSTEIEVSELVGAFVRALQPEIVVETGTAWGQTAEQIGLALARNGHGELFTMEPDVERAASSRNRCQGLPVTVLACRSDEWTPPGPVGFAWLDSLLPVRADEYRALRPHLSPGAVVGIHDAGPQHGMRDTWEALEGLRFIALPTPRGVLFGEVLR